MARMLYEVIVSACHESEKNSNRALRQTVRRYRVQVTSIYGLESVRRGIASNLERRFLFLLKVHSVAMLRKASSRERGLYLDIEEIGDPQTSSS